MSTFKNSLRAEGAKGHIKAHLDSEVKSLSVLMNYSQKRADLEKDFAKKLRNLSTKASKELKSVEPLASSGIVDACAAHVTHLEKEATMYEQRAERLTTLAMVDLGNLIQSKTSVKDNYHQARDEVDKALDQTKTYVTGCKKAYDKAAKAVASEEKKEKVRSRKKGLSLRKGKSKLAVAVVDAVVAHNEYVAALGTNNEHVDRYNKELLPNVLETLGDLEQFSVAEVQGVLKQITNAVDSRSDNYQVYQGDLATLQETIDTLDGAREYTPLCLAGSEFTDLVQPLAFKFADDLSEQANADQYSLLDSAQIVITDSLKDVQSDVISGLQVEIDDFEKQIDEENIKIERCADSPADLSVHHDDRPQQVQAFSTLRRHIYEKAKLECELAKLSLKKKLLEDGMKNAISSPEPADPEPPARPPKKGSIRGAPAPPPKDEEDSDDIMDQKWFHGVLARASVSELLIEQPGSAPGDFLVRASARDPEQLVLSVRSAKKSAHFKITKDETDKYSFEGDAFDTVPQLIKYHLATGEILTHKSGARLIRPVIRRQRPFRHDDIKLGAKLGKGNFGDVMRGTIVRTGVDCAVKTCKKESNASAEAFLEEADTLSQYEHPHIVTLFGVVKTSPVMILLELCMGGELLKFLRLKEDTIEVGQRLKMCHEAALGMAYLHSKSCIHRDLAARNCLLTGGIPNTLKISDFGMSRTPLADEEEAIYTVSTTAKTIPIRWTAPEALEHLEYTMASDIWSFGILMWEIFAMGKIPYAGFTNAQVRHNVISRGERLSQPDECPDAAYGVMMSTWHKAHTDRPLMKNLCVELDGIKAKYPYDSEVC